MLMRCAGSIANLVLIVAMAFPAFGQTDSRAATAVTATADTATAAAQDSVRRNPDRQPCRAPEHLLPASGGWWPAIRRVLIPKELSLAYDLRALIAAQQPLRPRSREGDLRRLDAIYLRALYLAEGNTFLALIALSIATLPYHTFPARVPLLGIVITIPVSTESMEDYQRRMDNLPGLLLPDSPASLDRDKLPHFFGSAWLQCVSRNPDLVSLVGELLELGEEIFKLEGSRDERDILVNNRGIAFAIALQQHKNVLPSEFFK